MRIAVMGAGGLGGYVGGRLAEAGESVVLIARGPQLEALRRRGLRVESPLGNAALTVEATDDPATIGPVDLILFTVKLGATEPAARLIAPLLGPRTRVVPLQNGIDGKAMLARHLDERSIAAGCSYISAAVAEPGVVHSPGGDRRIIVDGLDGDPTVAAFVAACGRATGLDATTSEDIAQTLWEKFVAFSTFSAITCLTRAPIGAIFAHPDSAAFLRRLLEETLAVAQAEGRRFPDDKADQVVAFFRGLPGSTKSSTLFDLEAGRPLETPWLSGRIVNIGRDHGIETPAHSAVVAALAPHVGGSVPFPAD